MLIRLAPLLFVLLWSTGWLIVGASVPHADPLTFLSLRFALAAALIAAFCVAVGARFPSRPAGWAHGVAAGVLMQGLYLCGVWWAIAEGVPAGISGLIAAVQPLLTAMLGGRFGGAALRPSQWLGVALGLAGVLAVIAPKVALPGEGRDLLWPILANVGGMVAATAGAFYQKVFCVEEDPRSGVALQAIGGFLPALVLAALTEPMVIVWRFETIASLIWAVFALSFAASALFFLMIRAGAVAEVSSLLFLMQPLVALQAWALLGERFTLAQGAGFALTVLGVYLAMRRAPA